MSDPDWLTPDDDKAPIADRWGYILRICLVVFLGLILWQAMLVSGRPRSSTLMPSGGLSAESRLDGPHR
jgi:hypothetical protein